MTRVTMLRCISCIALLFMSATASAQTDREAEVNSLFHKFIDAQNAHDLKTVGQVLQDSPHTLWVARSGVTWGHDAILSRFVQNYRGTWIIKPDFNKTTTTVLSPDVVQVFSPAAITVGLSADVAEQHQFLLTQIYVKTPDGWKLASILTLLSA